MSKRQASSAELLRIAVDDEGGRSVCWVSGDLDAASAGRLRSVLAEQLEGGRSAVVDLSGLGFVDSSGLGVLVGALKRYEAAGRTLTLRRPTPSLRRVLDMTGLGDAFTVEG